MYSSPTPENAIPPHLYFFGVAHAGTGKGIVDWSYLLAEPLHAYYEKKGEEEEKI